MFTVLLSEGQTFYEVEGPLAFVCLRIGRAPGAVAYMMEQISGGEMAVLRADEKRWLVQGMPRYWTIDQGERLLTIYPAPADVWLVLECVPDYEEIKRRERAGAEYRRRVEDVRHG